MPGEGRHAPCAPSAPCAPVHSALLSLHARVQRLRAGALLQGPRGSWVSLAAVRCTFQRPCSAPYCCKARAGLECPWLPSLAPSSGSALRFPFRCWVFQNISTFVNVFGGSLAVGRVTTPTFFQTPRAPSGPAHVLEVAQACSKFNQVASRPARLARRARQCPTPSPRRLAARRGAAHRNPHHCSQGVPRPTRRPHADGACIQVGSGL